MSYIIRVVGYNAYWTDNTEPGKCWSFDINEAKQFDNKEEPQKIVDSGNNMEVVNYELAIPDITELKASPDLTWQTVDAAQKAADEYKKTMDQQNVEDDLIDNNFVNLSVHDFDDNPTDERIETVDVEVID